MSEFPHKAYDRWVTQTPEDYFGEDEENWDNEEQRTIKTKWKDNIPACKKGKNHRWSKEETGICIKCGYDVFDGYYKSNRIITSMKGGNQNENQNK